MRRIALVLLLVFTAGFLAIMSAQDQTSDDPLTLGVQAYKNGQYDVAIEYFKKAVAQDSQRLNARLYLATAYAQQVIPNVETDENKRTAQMAIDGFRAVLDLNPNDGQKASALRGIASICFNINELDRAKEYQQKVIEADPKDPEAYYTIGVIDWTQCYKPRMEARAKLKLEPNAPLTDPAVCSNIRSLTEAKVKEGIEMFAKALELRPDYDDAMAYMNLMYRERADIQCGDPAARAADLRKADEWVDLTLETKKRKVEAPPVRVMPPPK